MAIIKQILPPRTDDKREIDRWRQNVSRYLRSEYISPSSITVNASDGQTGTVTDIQTAFDGNVLAIEELSATPGFDIELHFTNVPWDFKRFVCHVMYEGSSTHGVGIDMENIKTSAWDKYTYFSNHLGYVWIEIAIPWPANYISANAVNGRIYHFSGGNASHTLNIDYVGLAN